MRAEGYRAIGEYKIRHELEYKAIDPLKQSLAVLSQPAAKERPIEYDLFLIDLALTMVELGGSDDDEIAKEKWSWTGRELPKLLQSTLDAIKAPEAKVIGLRILCDPAPRERPGRVGHQPGAAAEQQRRRGRPTACHRPLVALFLRQEKGVGDLVKAPDLASQPPELLARIGYAEFHARKGDFSEAMKFADFNGLPQEKLEACIGVAQVVLSSKKANIQDAVPFADKALEIAEKYKVPPWLLLQTIRVTARVKGSAAVPVGLLKALPASFQARGYLELVLADADASNAGPLGTSVLADIKAANPASPSLDFGWEALARQNAHAWAAAKSSMKPGCKMRTHDSGP